MIILSARANQGLRKAILKQAVDNLNAGRTVHLYSESLTLDEMLNKIEPQVINKENLRGLNIHVNLCDPEVVDSLIKVVSNFDVYHIIEDVKPFVKVLRNNKPHDISNTPLIFGLQLPDSDKRIGVTVYGGDLAYDIAVGDEQTPVAISTDFKMRD